MSVFRRGVLASALQATPPTSANIILGGRVTYGNSGNAENSFISSIGGSPAQSVLLEFLDPSTWANVWSTYGGYSSGFTGWPGPKCIKVPVQSTSNPLLWTDVTGGSQDSSITAYANYCYTNSVQYQCLGWEANQSTVTYAWGCQGNDTSGNQAGYVAACQHFKTVMNAAHSGYFKYIWCQSGLQNPGMTTMAPGGVYDWGADIYALDVYNVWYGSAWPGDSDMLIYFESGNTPNWNQIEAYAVAHSKGVGILEWGELAYSNSGGVYSPGDDPVFIENIHNRVLQTVTTYGINAFLWPWTNTGASPLTNFPSSITELSDLVASDIAANIIIGPGGASLQIGGIPNQTGTVGTVYGGYTMTATGGTPPYVFSGTGWPSGIGVNSSTGVISGTPTTAESVTVDALVTDNVANTSPTSFGFNISGGGGGSPVPSVPSGFAVPTTIRLNENFTTTTLNPTYWNVTDGGPIQNGTATWAYNVNMSNPSIGLQLTCNGSTGALVTSNGNIYGGGSAVFDFDPIGGGTLGYTGSIFVEYQGYVPPMPSNSQKVNYWPSFWTSSGGGSWPTYGEIDAMEGLTYNAVHCHGPSDDNLGGVDPPAGSNSASPGTHTYGFLWTASYVIFFVDGDFIIPGDQSSSTVYATIGGMGNLPQCILLQNAGSSSTTPGSSGTSVITVRYVRVWT